MCFSLILLSVDLSSPHVKNKMSKREFIRNTRGAVGAEGENRCFLLNIVKATVDPSLTVDFISFGKFVTFVLPTPD